MGSDNKAGKRPFLWKAPRDNTAENKINAAAKDGRIPIGKRHMMESRTMWLKNEGRRNAAPVVAWTTTSGDNTVSQSWLQQPSDTKIRETLNNHLNQELAHSRCTNLLLHDQNNQQRC